MSISFQIKYHGRSSEIHNFRTQGKYTNVEFFKKLKIGKNTVQFYILKIPTATQKGHCRKPNCYCTHVLKR